MPLSPTLFNVVVDTVIRHWVTVVVATEEVTGGLGMLIRDLASYFYANNGLVASTQPERLQSLFDVLTGLFVRVSISTNTWETVIMVFQPCHAPGRV